VSSTAISVVIPLAVLVIIVTIVVILVKCSEYPGLYSRPKQEQEKKRKKKKKKKEKKRKRKKDPSCGFFSAIDSVVTDYPSGNSTTIQHED